MNAKNVACMKQLIQEHEPSTLIAVATKPKRDQMPSLFVGIRVQNFCEFWRTSANYILITHIMAKIFINSFKYQFSKGFIKLHNYTYPIGNNFEEND